VFGLFGMEEPASVKEPKGMENDLNIENEVVLGRGCPASNVCKSSDKQGSVLNNRI
jgi:hypothetical protein